MKIIAHDEDSMTNLFFSEVHRHDKLNEFLGLIEWRNASALPFDVITAELHQQVNFSEFGRPDAIIIVTDSGGNRHIVIVEVKLGKYLDCCIATPDEKFDNKYNSRLNSQLSLRYRVMMSLSSIERAGHITEIPHSQHSPYSEDQIRRCKKPSTIALFRELADKSNPFYLVTLTADKMSPVSKAALERTDPCFPLFFDQHTDRPASYPHLGSVSWRHCSKLFAGLDSYFTESYKLYFDSAPDRAPVEPAPPKGEMFVTGWQVIEFDEKICFLTCKGYSFAIRHFRNGGFVEIYRGSGDREKYLGLESQIKVLRKAPREKIENAAFWSEYFGVSAGARQTSLPRPAVGPPNDLFVTGRHIVVFDNKICLLNCKGYSFAIRHFRNGVFVEIYRGKGNREKYLALQANIKFLQKAPREKVENRAFWEAFFASPPLED